MCDASMAIGAISTIASVVGGLKEQGAAKDQAKAQAKELQAQAAEQRRAAEEAQQIDLEALKERSGQLQDAAALEKVERVRQAEREQAKIRVAASEAGVLGNSVLAQLSSSMLMSEYDTGIIDNNLDNDQAQIALERKAVNANATSRKNAADSTDRQAKEVKKSVKTNPLLSTFSIASNAANTGLGAYGTAKSVQNVFGGAGTKTTYVPHRSDGRH